jgi:ketosteroid isomerase-like protein
MAATTTEAEVREVVERMLDAMNRGDRERLRSCLSEDASAVHIGTDPDEWWSSAQVVETTGGGGPSGIQVVTDEVTVHPLGEDAAWLVGRGRFVAGERERPVRFSGVATRDGDRWAFVHSHTSIGVSNDELFD